MQQFQNKGNMGFDLEYLEGLQVYGVLGRFASIFVQSIQNTLTRCEHRFVSSAFCVMTCMTFRFEALQRGLHKKVYGMVCAGSRGDVCTLVLPNLRSLVILCYRSPYTGMAMVSSILKPHSE